MKEKGLKEARFSWIRKKAEKKDLSKRFYYLEPTPVFNAYWLLAAERMEIFFKRLKEEEAPWTKDTILQEGKFTNSYRVLDRVTQYLIKEIQQKTPKKGKDENIEEQVFRTLLFRIFNKIETWKLLMDNLGEISWKKYNRKKYEDVLTHALERGDTIYSVAYIMPTGGKEYDSKAKHTMHLDLIEQMMKDGVPRQLNKVGMMKEAFKILKSYDSIGGFLAYQYVTDINYTRVTNFSEMEFVVPGPGAHRGIEKCFRKHDSIDHTEIIELVTKYQREEFKRMKIDFESLFGRPLQLIDCQNLFCEIDKYARVAFPEYNTEKSPTKIKQKYKEGKIISHVVLPEKWGM